MSDELDFYSTILTTGDAPLWRDDLTNNLGTPVIGLGVRTPEYNTSAVAVDAPFSGR